MAESPDPNDGIHRIEQWRNVPCYHGQRNPKDWDAKDEKQLSGYPRA